MFCWEAGGGMEDWMYKRREKNYIKYVSWQALGCIIFDYSIFKFLISCSSCLILFCFKQYNSHLFSFHLFVVYIKIKYFVWNCSLSSKMILMSPIKVIDCVYLIRNFRIILKVHLVKVLNCLEHSRSVWLKIAQVSYGWFSRLEIVEVKNPFLWGIGVYT